MSASEMKPHHEQGVTEFTMVNPEELRLFWLSFIFLANWHQLVIGMLSGKQTLCLQVCKEIFQTYSRGLGKCPWRHKTGRGSWVWSTIPRMDHWENGLLSSQEDKPGIEFFFPACCLIDFSFHEACISPSSIACLIHCSLISNVTW